MFDCLHLLSKPWKPNDELQTVFSHLLCTERHTNENEFMVLRYFISYKVASIKTDTKPCFFNFTANKLFAISSKALHLVHNLVCSLSILQLCIILLTLLLSRIQFSLCWKAEWDSVFSSSNSVAKSWFSKFIEIII